MEFSTASSVRATKNVAARLCFRPLQHLLDRELGFRLIHIGLQSGLKILYERAKQRDQVHRFLALLVCGALERTITFLQNELADQTTVLLVHLRALHHVTLQTVNL